jgi:hypothetical protein
MVTARLAGYADFDQGTEDVALFLVQRRLAVAGHTQQTQALQENCASHSSTDEFAGWTKKN